MEKNDFVKKYKIFPEKLSNSQKIQLKMFEILKVFQIFFFFYNIIFSTKNEKNRWDFFKVHLRIEENRSKVVSERFRQFEGKKTQGQEVMNKN